VAVIARTVMSATVIAAGVSTVAVLVVMVITFHIGIKSKRAAKQCFDCGITGTANATVKLDSSLGKCHLCTTADAAANKSIYAKHRKQACKCSVTAAVGVNHFAFYNCSILCGINLKLLGVTEVLKDLPIFVSYCNFHCAVSFELSIVKDFSAFLN